MSDTFNEFRNSLSRFISGEATCGFNFEQLALRLFALQFESILPYRRFCEGKGTVPATIGHWSQIPAFPTSTFKDLELSSIPPDQRITVFHSSGTTEQRPSRHYHSLDSLALYERSLTVPFYQHFLGDWDDLAAMDVVGPLDKPGFIILTPPPTSAPNSSLVHMFETVRKEFGSRDSFFAGRLDSADAWNLDIEQALFGIRKSMCANRPVALVGTAFSFVHLLDHFAANNMRYRLAAGSRVLETGGYKGRSREMPKKELHALITRHLGIPDSHIVCEYGMSELSSQAYDRSITFQEGTTTPPEVGSPRLFRFPSWARIQIVSPENGREVREGEAGLIKIFDLANVHSIFAVQTEDLGVRRGDGFELIGRNQIAEPRGCSLMAV